MNFREISNEQFLDKIYYSHNTYDFYTVEHIPLHVKINVVMIPSNAIVVELPDFPGKYKTTSLIILEENVNVLKYEKNLKMSLIYEKELYFPEDFTIWNKYENNYVSIDTIIARGDEKSVWFNWYDEDEFKYMVSKSRKFLEMNVPDSYSDRFREWKDTL